MLARIKSFFYQKTTNHGLFFGIQKTAYYLKADNVSIFYFLGLSIVKAGYSYGVSLFGLPVIRWTRPYYG